MTGSSRSDAASSRGHIRRNDSWFDVGELHLCSCTGLIQRLHDSLGPDVCTVFRQVSCSQALACDVLVWYYVAWVATRRFWFAWVSDVFDTCNLAGLGWSE